MELHSPPLQSLSATFLSLPVELRLQIAEYALDQCTTAGLPRRHQLPLDNHHVYRPSSNLSLLLVCRQFHEDFSTLAYNKTRFTLQEAQLEEGATQIRTLPVQKLESIRKIALGPLLTHRPWNEMDRWAEYVYNEKRLHLDELALICPLPIRPVFVRTPVHFLRNLRHVKVIKFLLYAQTDEHVRIFYRRLVLAIMEQDQLYRYDASEAPNIEATWWDWSYDPEEGIITLQAQRPRPTLPKEEYMLLMAELSLEAERAAPI